MKAIRVRQFGEPDVLRVEDEPNLEPAAGQVLVRLEAAGVNPVEAYVRAGHYGPLPTLPYTPGSDGAGVVEAVGPGVVRVAAGDRVYLSAAITGTYAEKALVAEEHLYPLPERVSFAQGAAVGIPYATAYRALFQRAKAEPGEVVLVHGASGGVGLAAVQLAVARGIRVIGTAGSEEGRCLVLAQGAEHVLDHGKEGYLRELIDLTAGRGPDVILEMLANVNLGRDLEVLAPCGRVVVIGSRGPVEITPRDLMNREGSIHAMRLPNATAEERARAYAVIHAGLENGTLRPVVREVLPLSQAAEAHRRLFESKAAGKIVLAAGP
ncbi:MAG: NADPH:quinone reductase [Myxococcales bacterium]|jgi:NADPH2:quinone reductase